MDRTAEIWCRTDAADHHAGPCQRCVCVRDRCLRCATTPVFKPGNASVFLSLIMAAVTIAMILARIFVAGTAGAQPAARGLPAAYAVQRPIGPRSNGCRAREVANSCWWSSRPRPSWAARSWRAPGSATSIAFLIEGHSYSLVLGISVDGRDPGRDSHATRAWKNWLEQRQHRIQEIRDMAEPPAERHYFLHCGMPRPGVHGAPAASSLRPSSATSCSTSFLRSSCSAPYSSAAIS